MVMVVKSAMDSTSVEVGWTKKVNHILLCQASSFPMALGDDLIFEPKKAISYTN